MHQIAAAVLGRRCGHNGAALLGTHGSAEALVACNTGTTAAATISLPGVATVANANAVTVKLYAKSSGLKKSSHDLLQLGITYSLR